MEEIVVVVHISCFLSGKRCSWPPSLLAAGYSLSFLISNVGLAWRVVDRHGKAKHEYCKTRKFGRNGGLNYRRLVGNVTKQSKETTSALLTSMNQL